MIVLAGWIASALVFTSFFMKTIVPLRLVAIASNLAFMTYGLLGLRTGVFGDVYPIFVLHACLLPVNVIRLVQIRRLTTAARSSDRDLIAVLLPFMRREAHGRGTVLFRRGDAAERLYVIGEGSVLLQEDQKRLEAGDVFGELGLFAADNARAMTAVCADDCVLFSLGREKALELYYQHPAFGIFLLRLVAGYVSELRAAADGLAAGASALPARSSELSSSSGR
ncbi:MAG TPA: cyclic nucleotide-binding domain-containing protein [Gaiellaceae bacterium]|nr:cyclic nucleotide-binding domain-containing protein [Gaiellaceae bacterium]